MTSAGKDAGVPSSNAAPASSRASASFPIVGIGASAGGLEAFTELIHELPSDLGMAYVLVTHLYPERESAIPQILGRTTAMPVVQIENEMTIERDHVYVIPPNCDLEMSGLRLRIFDREEGRAVNAAVDIFFRSLAEQHGPNAIGIVLSGMGSDGTVGLTAIKAEGGITFAQDSRSAKYDGMPASAVAAGCVDFVLRPREMVQELARIRQHPYLTRPTPVRPEAEEGGSEVYMAQIFRLLRRATRVDFSEYKPPTIRRRIHRRMVLHRLEKLSEYVALLHRDRDEVDALYRDLLITVTSFFRNPEAFEALSLVVYPDLVASRGRNGLPIRIWVPGCSTGEEAYSHAISLVEYLGEDRPEIPIQIFSARI